MKLALLLALLLPANLAAEDGISVEYLAAPENQLLWFVESWHQLPRGWRLEPSLAIYRPPHGSVVHRTASLGVGWEPTRRWDFLVKGGWTPPRDGYESRHAGAEVLYLILDRAPQGAGLGNLKAGPGVLFTRHTDEKLSHVDAHSEHAGRVVVEELALSVKVALEAARSRWTLILRKSLYDHQPPVSPIARFGGAAGGGLSTLDHSPSAETVLRGFNDSAQSLRWDPRVSGPIEFFLQYERSTFTNRRSPAHEYQAGFLWDLGRTGFGLTLRRYDARVHHATDALIFEWRLKLA